MAEYSLQALHDYIEADPLALGLKEANGDWKADSVIADMMNDATLGGTIQRELVSPQEIIEQITIADWGMTSVAHRLYIQLLPSLETISTVQNGTEVRNNLLSIFTEGMDTRANLIAVVQRDGSPAEAEWGEGTFVGVGDVGHAANL
jgi:hypothetical protein